VKNLEALIDIITTRIYYNNEKLMRNTIETEEEKIITVMRIQGEM